MRSTTLRAAMVTTLLALAPACSNNTTEPDASVHRDASAVVLRDASMPILPGLDAGLFDAGRPQLKIKTVLPSRGPVAGGTLVTVEGGAFYQGFAAGATDAEKQTHIHFGDNEVAQFDIIDDDTLELTTPPNPAGAVDVVIQNPNGSFICPQCFTYYVDLELDSVTPATGPLEGGAQVELKGSAFSPGVTVLLGDKACPVVTLVDDGTVRVSTPPADAPGPVDVVLFNKNGVGEIRRGFTYVDAVRVDRVEPPYGPLAGKNVVSIVGASLSGTTKVSFGAKDAAFKAQADGSLSATVPTSLVAGAVDVVVVTPGGTAMRPAGYVYFDPAAASPAIVGVWPTHGVPAGGNQVAVVGSGFDDTTTFTIGGVVASVVGAVDPNVVTLTVPPASAANQWVAVRASSGATLAHGYHYNVELDSLAPTSGAAKGGDPVTLAGKGFASGLEVLFGALAATGVTAPSATSIAATTPAGTSIVDVRVRDPKDLENEAVLAKGFRFVEAVSAGRVAPELGSIAGGTYVTVLGTGFAPGVSVLFGTATLKDLQVVDAHTIIGHSPPGVVGAVDVTVKLAAAQDVSPGAFTYFDPTSGGGGSTGGPLDGTINVTVLESSWSRYGQPVTGATVMLGDDPATPFQGKTDSHGQITFSDPSLVKAQTVTVFKDGYSPVTIASQDSQDLTVYLSAATSLPGGPGAPPPSSGGNPAIIAGTVTGFKLPRALTSSERAWAEVWVVPSSPYSTPPFGWTISGDSRDARGERWKVTQDGGAYSVFAGGGLTALYAVYGIFDNHTQVFTPVLMGILRGIEASADKPAVGQAIVLDMHLDQTVPVHLDTPAWDPTVRRMATTQVFAWLELGGEGVIPLGSVTTGVPDVDFPSVPEVDGDSLLFATYAIDGQGPDAYAFGKQLGSLAQGMTIGPTVGLLAFTAPREGDDFTGTLAWESGSVTPIDIVQVSLSKTEMILAGTIQHWDGTGWSTLPEGSDAALQGVWGTDKKNAWAVGQRGTILHWHGTAWTGAASPTSALLFAVWGSGASDVWAVGDQGTIVHFDGQGWQVVPSGTLAPLYAVWGTSDADAWAVGGQGTILRWDGKAWTSAPSAVATGTLYGLWGTGAGDVWAVGDLGGSVLHWDGSGAWQASATGGSDTLFGVWGTGATDVWAVGNLTSQVAHWDGTGWMLIGTDVQSALYSVWGAGPTDVLAVGDPGVEPQWNGTEWQSTGSSTSNLRAIWGSAADDVWIVGSNSSQGSWTSVWSAIVPGTQQSVSLPQNLLDDLRATSGPDDLLTVQLTAAHSARFDWAHWTYSSLSEDTWNTWADVSGTFTVFPPRTPLP